MLYFLAILLTIFTVAGQPCLGGRENLDFETGDFTGWTGIIPGFPAPGAAAVETQHGVVEPLRGSYFARLKAGGEIGTDDGNPDGTSLQRILRLDSGQMLTGHARFFNAEQSFEQVVSDFASVTVTPNPFNGFVWSQISSETNHGLQPWEHWFFHVPFSGEYKLTLFVGNFGDDLAPSTAYFDGISVVPESSSIALYGLGLTILIAYLWNQRYRLRG